MDFATITSSVVLSACVAGLVSLINGALTAQIRTKN